MISAIGSTHAFAPPRRALALIPRLPDSPSVDRFEAANLAALPPDPTPTAKPEAKWHKDQIIYFPMTDRFMDGDTSNDYLVRRDDPTGFWGGDLAGLTQKLDYIKGLGATTIWLSPVADNANELTIGNYHGYGHHGYWINDHEKVEEHQGTLATAQHLVEEAHKRGLKVVLDVVLNQVAPTHPFVSDPSKHDWFHHHGEIKNWEDPWETVYGDLGGLPAHGRGQQAVTVAEPFVQCLLGAGGAPCDRGHGKAVAFLDHQVEDRRQHFVLTAGQRGFVRADALVHGLREVLFDPQFSGEACTVPFGTASSGWRGPAGGNTWCCYMGGGAT